VPKELDVKLLFDQSLFVRAAIQGVVREALMAACLTVLLVKALGGGWDSASLAAVGIKPSLKQALQQ